MRKHIALLLLFAAACGAPDADPADDPAAAEGGKADGYGATSPVTVTVLRDPLLPRSFLDRGGTQVFTTSSTYRAFAGHDLPGVRWSAYEWVVLYAPGRSMLWGHPGLEVRGDASHSRFTVVRKLDRPGRGCVTPDFAEATGPYALVKFTASAAARIGYLTWRDDTTWSACTGKINWGCAYGACGGGQVCRLQNGTGSCVGAPWSCDDVLCGPGKTCAYLGDRAACVKVWGLPGFTASFPSRPPIGVGDANGAGVPDFCATPIGQPPCDANPAHPPIGVGPNNVGDLCTTFPGQPPCDGPVVSFPPAGPPPINLACYTLSCNPGWVCQPSTGTCVLEASGWNGAGGAN